MDDDDKKPKDAAAEPNREAAQDEGAPLRKVSEEKIKQIIAAHETCVKTAGEKGKRADLNGADLQGANLTGANLQGANLGGANLEGADLTNAKYLTRRQLDDACGDEETTLPDYLADYQMKPCPTPEQSPAN